MLLSALWSDLFSSAKLFGRLSGSVLKTLFGFYEANNARGKKIEKKKVLLSVTCPFY